MSAVGAMSDEAKSDRTDPDPDFTVGDADRAGDAGNGKGKLAGRREEAPVDLVTKEGAELLVLRLHRKGGDSAVLEGYQNGTPNFVRPLTLFGGKGLRDHPLESQTRNPAVVPQLRDYGLGIHGVAKPLADEGTGQGNGVDRGAPLHDRTG